MGGFDRIEPPVDKSGMLRNLGGRTRWSIRVSVVSWHAPTPPLPCSVKRALVCRESELKEGLLAKALHHY